MGAQPYWYYVPLESDIETTLESLRVREFSAGRYRPVMLLVDFTEDRLLEQTSAPTHASIQEAIRAAGPDGTASILDVRSISSTPRAGAVTCLSGDLLSELFGTTRPMRKDASVKTLLDEINRGQCACVVLYDERQSPSEVLFAGYSFD